jgi:F-type H+-transporting ATPase subunit g
LWDIEEFLSCLVSLAFCSIPGRYEAFWKEVDYMKQKLLARNDLKLEEVGIAALFAGECYAWFCVGEIVGRGGTLTGYRV